MKCLRAYALYLWCLYISRFNPIIMFKDRHILTLHSFTPKDLFLFFKNQANSRLGDLIAHTLMVFLILNRKKQKKKGAYVSNVHAIEGQVEHRPGYVYNRFLGQYIKVSPVELAVQEQEKAKHKTCLMKTNALTIKTEINSKHTQTEKLTRQMDVSSTRKIEG